MYICPICNKEFEQEERMIKHLNSCWKEQNPYRQSKPAPQSADISTRVVSDDIANFFNSFKKE